jgi:hypothetical protein
MRYNGDQEAWYGHGVNNYDWQLNLNYKALNSRPTLGKMANKTPGASTLHTDQFCNIHLYVKPLHNNNNNNNNNNDGNNNSSFTSATLSGRFSMSLVMP